MYKVYTSFIYSDGEEPIPGYLLKQFDSLTESIQFVKDNSNLYLFITDEKGNILYPKLIFESPDKGKTIYQRNVLDLERKRIK